MFRFDQMRFPLPSFIQFYPTFRCNQKCSFCFNDSSQSSEISFDNALRLLSILSKNGIEELDVMGGEPLLLDWMPDFVGAALRNGLSVNLSTNGSVPDITGRFLDFSGRDFTIGLSLEGSTGERHRTLTRAGHFSCVLRNITELLSAGFNPVVKTVVNRDTMADIQGIVDLLKEIGVRRYYLLHMDLLSGSDSSRFSALSYPAFLSFYEKIRGVNPEMSILKVNASCFEKNTLPSGVRCAAGVKKVAVMPDGSVYPCNLFHHIEEFNLGNMFRDNLAVIWGGPKLDVFRRTAANSCTLPDCANRAFCTGGCPAHGYFHYGRTDSVDVRCTAGTR
ncbi:MAG: radical SAM protein [Acidobacteriota bacterium]